MSTTKLKEILNNVKEIQHELNFMIMTPRTNAIQGHINEIKKQIQSLIDEVNHGY